MSNSIPIKIKHAGKVYPIDVDLNESGLTLKMQVSSLTNVPPERQKILVRGGPLKDDAELSKVGLKPNQAVMVLGTPLEEVLKKEDVSNVQFIEDRAKESGALVNADLLNAPSGLSNLGNTCYLNSSIQLLHTITELRDQLSNTEFGTVVQDSELLLVANVKALFKRMDSGNEKKVVPLNMLASARNAFPQFQETTPEGFHKQQDAEEAYSQILSAVLNKFPNLKKYLDIELKTETRCLEDASEEVQYGFEESLKLNCHINSHVNFLMDGLKNGLKETIEKHSDNLNRNAKYEITRKIVRLPKYLTVHFVRFYWKRETNKKAKIMRKVQFPFQLDVTDLVDSNERENLIKARDAISQVEKENEEEYRQLKRFKPSQELTTREQYEKQNEEMKKMRTKCHDKFNEMLKNLNGGYKEGENPSSLYELGGIIAHQGASADSGHYQAFIRDEEDLTGERWYKFNDDIVTVVSKEKIAALAGGSEGDSALVLIYKGVGV
ncbi:hypothetical protein PICMEDRAFT_148322 [Pichia membranifaciens NRRL Y-2026]|uniref:Ubiquitin carboxyl-terminal hydrolase n=1 Tax=Pichia membranifaciens NRRL Y-2026 TaxID=763406 RepID=A0A1E3NIT3_9ASCO|nr:hypothetical protein PICMEDRAFT_148322 [Pichia membranifaciens NRRL Y-2026]ODQ45976.1 hypothetical protein PICMEDRAFT_148322 [Pichia membranifaciens NRRL Y-2026]